VKHIHRIVEMHRIGEPEGVAAMIFDQLKHARSLAFPRLGRRRNATLLNEAERIAEVVDNFVRERQQVLRRCGVRASLLPEEITVRKSNGTHRCGDDSPPTDGS
jgi:hypothetical protein